MSQVRDSTWSSYHEIATLAQANVIFSGGWHVVSTSSISALRHRCYN